MDGNYSLADIAAATGNGIFRLISDVGLCRITQRGRLRPVLLW